MTTHPRVEFLDKLLEVRFPDGRSGFVWRRIGRTNWEGGLGSASIGGSRKNYNQRQAINEVRRIAGAPSTDVVLEAHRGIAA